MTLLRVRTFITNTPILRSPGMFSAFSKCISFWHQLDLASSAHVSYSHVVKVQLEFDQKKKKTLNIQYVKETQI
jgi:hypothetical protein